VTRHGPAANVSSETRGRPAALTEERRRWAGAANVSWESLVERHVTEVLSENETEDEIEAGRKDRQSGKYKKVSLTDPDARSSRRPPQRSGS
jgi:hypothetical protein